MPELPPRQVCHRILLSASQSAAGDDLSNEKHVSNNTNAVAAWVFKD
ncbi:MAG: hypothetical protein ACKVON_02720 [Beijerinckiaceae bacterium]